MGALEEEDDDIYEVEKRQDYDHAVTDDGGAERQFGWTGPHSIGDRWTTECFVKASRMPKRTKVSVCLSVCLSIESNIVAYLHLWIQLATIT